MASKSKKKSGAAKKRRIVKQAKAKKSKFKTYRKPLDPELAAMDRELRKNNRPAMFDSVETESSKSKLVQLEEEANEDNLKTYYKNMAFKCVKCDGRFDHQANLPPIEYELKCPHCNEIHMLRFTPASKLFTVNSGTMDILGSRKSE
jgi:hypothetical protein